MQAEKIIFVKMPPVKKEDLIELIDSWENLDFLVREISINPELFSELMEIALYNPAQKTWRAAYLAEKIHDEYPELLLPYLGKMIQQLKVEENSSKKRHFLKLLSMNQIPEKQYSFLMDYCLNTFDSDKEPPAVRVHAMQILFNISEEEPELKPEILAIIEHETEYHATAGIRARGLKLAEKLHRQINKKN